MSRNACWRVRLMVGVLGMFASLAGCGGGGGAADASGTPVAGAPAPSPSPGPTQPAVTFRGDVVLGSPTEDSVKVNVYAADQSGTVWVTYGSAPEVLMRQTARATLQIGRAHV